jgi:sodium-coupled neutral amino acid transporter 9
MEDNINSGNVNEEKLVKNENERESDVELGRITGKTLEKIKKLEEVPDSKKVSSLQTVFSVWNTMIGSSIVSIPYNVYCTGIIPTVVIGLVYGFICYFTCSIVVKLGGNEEEFANVVYNYFNYAFGKRYAKIGRIFQITFNLMINIGATFIYFLIINQNLYPCLCLFLKIFNCDLDEEDLTPSFSKFSLLYCALIVSVLVFPLTILKEMGALVKFNSYGIYFVSVLLIFVIFNGFLTISKDHFHFEYIDNYCLLRYYMCIYPLIKIFIIIFNKYYL